MPKFRHILISLSGLAVEFGWAVGESIMLPHLIAAPLSVLPSVAGLIFALDPILSFFAGLVVGSVADGKKGSSRGAAKMARQRILLVTACGALLGLVALLFAPLVHERAGQIVVIFIAFGWMDLCHDVILIPGRSLLIADMCESAVVDVDGAGDALYSQLQLFGRMFGLVTITFLPNSLLGLSYFESAWVVSGIVLLVCSLTSLMASCRRSGQIQELSARAEFGADFPEDLQFSQEEVSLGGNSGVASEDSERERSLFDFQLARKLFALLSIQFSGWIAIMVFTMWCSTWLGLSTKISGLGLSLPLVAMTLHAVIGALTAPVLVCLNRKFSVVGVWFVTEMLLLCSFVSFRWLGPGQPLITLAVCGAGGVQYLVHSSNAQFLCRVAVNRDDMVSWAITLVQTTMPLAQIVVGLFAGLIVGNCPDTGHCPGVSDLYFYVGIGGLIFNTSVALLDIFFLRSGLFVGTGGPNGRPLANESTSDVVCQRYGAMDSN